MEPSNKDTLKKDLVVKSHKTNTPLASALGLVT